jgi:hypothetical protein
MDWPRPRIVAYFGVGWPMRSYVAVDDVGRAVNPLIVESQIHGG